MFLNSPAAIADSTWKPLIMDREHSQPRFHPIQSVVHCQLRTEFLSSIFKHITISSWSWLAIFGIPQVALSQSIHLVDTVEQKVVRADSAVPETGLPLETPLTAQTFPEGMPEKAQKLMPATTQTVLPSALDHPMVVPPQPIGCWKLTQGCSFFLDSTIAGVRSLSIPAPSESLEGTNEDLELGTLRAREVPNEIEVAADPELGDFPVEEAPLSPPQISDPDVEPIPIPPVRRQPSVYLLGRLDYFKSSNVFATARAFRDPEEDGLIRTGLTLFYAPAIGKKTFLVTSIDANLIRYANVGDGNSTRRSANYDELRYRVGIFHRLSPRMAGEIGWSNQKLYQAKEGLQVVFGGPRIFNDNAIRFELSRQDPLSKKLALNSFYQFRWSFADATDFDRDRFINTFITSLSYSWTPTFQTAIDYQYAWTHFTKVSRDDHYHQLLGRLTYTMSPRTQLNVFGGFSFGGSTGGVRAQGIDYNGVVFGAGFVFNLPLF
jgi:hypothetical protein